MRPRKPDLAAVSAAAARVAASPAVDASPVAPLLLRGCVLLRTDRIGSRWLLSLRTITASLPCLSASFSHDSSSPSAASSCSTDHSSGSVANVQIILPSLHALLNIVWS